MSIKCLAVTPLLLATLAAAPATARPLWLGFDAGVGIPIGDFSDAAGLGWNAGLTGDCPLNSAWSLGGELGWHSFSGSDDAEKALSAALSAQAGTPVTADLRYTVVPVLLHAKLHLPTSSKWDPYLVGGLGLYRVTQRTDTSQQDTKDSSTDFGWKLGGGADVKLAETVSVGGEALYRWIGTEGSATSVISLRGHLAFKFGAP